MSEQDCNVVDQKSQTEFRPTYLYVKTHNVTGLKYFGKTILNDPISYKGSGTYWKNHIKKHGYDVTTEVIGLFYDKDECCAVATEFSLTNNIVEDKRWANLKDENGMDGSGIFSEATKKKISEGIKNSYKDGERIDELRAIGKKRFAEGTHPFIKINISNKEKIINGTHHFLGGEIQKRTAKENSRRRIESGKHKFTFDNPSYHLVTCEHCSKSICFPVYVRCHGDKCVAKGQYGFLL